MTVLAGLAALLLAAAVGYYVGRRAGSAPPSWRRRTSRVALGKLAVTLLVLVTARRIRRKAPTVRFFDPLLLLRGGVARARSW